MLIVASWILNYTLVAVDVVVVVVVVFVFVVDVQIWSLTMEPKIYK